ncbi:glycosyltransferase [Dictyobacter arantiisoli]|uniref:glycosyltransferase n=1 Tax=Dictyobacter arantiisoli TaxID=2014874 RepID=UPI00155A7650|nr:glycosyltransferase [Dictyobacter arantiisoli]
MLKLKTAISADRISGHTAHPVIPEDDPAELATLTGIAAAPDFAEAATLSLDTVNTMLPTQKIAAAPDFAEVATLSLDTVNTMLPTQKTKVVRRKSHAAFAETEQKNDLYDLTVVTPTRNERDNVRPLLQILKDALAGVRVEVIFVDDSDDDTPAVIQNITQILGTPTFHIRVEHRAKGPARAGGLATAVDLGLRSARARYVAVIDADLQHPPAQLRIFYDEAVKQDVDLILASRYIKGGSTGGLDGVSRLLFSIGLKTTAKILFPDHLAGVSDPLGGFFLLRRSLLNDVVLRPIGYKILLEILVRCQWNSLVEVPYHFQQREHGQSKADFKQGITALQHMWRLFKEVPSAGRVWKCAGLVITNVLLMGLLVLLANALPAIWQPISVLTFALLALLNFTCINRFIFPATPVKDAPLPDSLSLLMEPPIPHPVKDTSLRGRAVTTLSLVAVVIAIGWISLTLPGAWVVIGALFVGFSVLNHKHVTVSKLMPMLLGMLVGIASIDYLSWRFAVTNWSGWWIAIPLLAAETMGAIHTLGFQYTLWPWPHPRLRLTEDPTRFPVYIFIPTVNEGASILEPTIKGALAARARYLAQYPHGQVTIVICNDGYVAKNPNWEEMEHLARRIGVVCVTRTVGGGAKAGNIEHARQFLKATDNALLVIFDADQIARPEFLLKTVPAFGDPSIGWVQTGQYYSNLENPVARWADDQQSMFYNLLCPGKASLNSAFICGTNVVLRARALDQIGGLPQDSVTEDFSASIALHPTWRSVFLTDVLATGMGPLDLPSYLKQQRRWAIGTLGVLRTNWRDIFLPRKNGLSLAQRIQYLLACTHYLCGVRDLIYLICPMLFVLTAVPAVRGSTLFAFAWHFLPYWIVSLVSLWYAGRGITGLRGIVIGFGSFPVLLESLLSVILQRKVGFSVTSKSRTNKRSYNHLLIYVVFLLAGLFCIGLTVVSKSRQQASMLISEMWIVYSMCMLISFLWLGIRDLRFQKRAGQEMELAHLKDYPSRLHGRESGLRPLGNVLAALALACLVFGSGIIHPDVSQATPFTIASVSTTTPLTGVSLPVQLLQQRPAVLEQTLNTHFSIVGRTQDVHDLFNRDWANTLVAHNERPWITLEFGTFGANGKPPADASLSAIANGLHDSDLQRWAQSIRDYGKPVYLTALLHVDRNWALSSAVANGGIPQDAPRAWNHIQSIFHTMQANNVAWIWAPADPAHDTVYAPPVSSINAVLLSMISYPKTKWVDPAKTLQAVTAHYKHTPIIVEVSAAGDAAQKASWLTKVGNAVDAEPNVYALIYHEGSPAINPTAAQNKQWSILSDPSSEQAWQHIVSSLQIAKTTAHR